MDENKNQGGKLHVAVALDESQYGTDIIRWSAANIFPNAKKVWTRSSSQKRGMVQPLCIAK